MDIIQLNIQSFFYMHYSFELGPDNNEKIAKKNEEKPTANRLNGVEWEYMQQIYIHLTHSSWVCVHALIYK